MKKALISLFAGAVVLGAFPAAGSAQTTSIADLQAQIQALLAQIQSLNQQIQALQGQRKEVVRQVGEIILTHMREGDEGDKVTLLQALLAADPALYPEGLITGYYGRLTAAAIRRFQARNGIEQVGFIGPKTLAQLNKFLEKHPLAFEHDDDDEEHEDQGAAKRARKEAKNELKALKAADKALTAVGRVCAKVPPGHLIAPGWLRKHDGVHPIVPICQTLPPGIVQKLPSGTATSTPTSTDAIAPVISNVSANTSANSAIISWQTNEPATTQVAYGTSTGYGFMTALNTLLTYSHIQALSGLSASTTYHYYVLSKDASGNVATSTDKIFTTAAADTTPPTISGIGVVATSTAAEVVWTTNESATGRVFYATSSPVDTQATSTLSVATSTLRTIHSLTLPGLATSTTYHFVIESKDAEANTATSTGSFSTNP